MKFSKPQEIYIKLICILAIVMTIWVAFLPSLNADFVNIDDKEYIYDNIAIQKFEIGNLTSWKGVFMDRVPGLSYAPLTSILFAFQKEMFGLDHPELWHLTSILLHIGVSLLVFFIGMKLDLGVMGACFLAILFGVHPMRVESVSWVTEQKDLFYALFYFLATLIYVDIKKSAYKHVRHLIILVLFVLCILCKIQGITLPLALILVDYWHDKEFRIAHIKNKIPMFTISIIFGVLSFVLIREVESIAAPKVFNLHDTIMWSGSMSWTYFYKLFWPHPLTIFYPYPTEFQWYEYFYFFIPTATVYFMFRTWSKKQYQAFFGLSFFAINILISFSVLFIKGHAYAADRYTYVAYFGLFFLLVYGMNKIAARFNLARWITTSLGLIVLVGLIFLTNRQSEIWNNSESLWNHQITLTPYIILPYKMRARHYMDEGMVSLSERDYDQILLLEPNDLESLNKKGEILISHNTTLSYNEAVQIYSKAILLNPENSSFYINRAVALGQLGHVEQAISDLDNAITIAPDHYEAYKNRAVLYNRLSMTHECIRDLDTYLAYEPNDANLWAVNAQLKSSLKDYENALIAINKALHLDTNNAYYSFEKGKIHYNLKEVQMAIKAIKKSISLGYKDQSGLSKNILDLK